MFAVHNDYMCCEGLYMYTLFHLLPLFSLPRPSSLEPCLLISQVEMLSRAGHMSLEFKEERSELYVSKLTR